MRFAVVATAMFVSLFALGSVPALGQDRDRDKTQDRDQTRDQIRDQDIYGSQLMTQQERNQYRERMRAAKTSEEQERIRAQHHREMQARAKERGVTLPAAPPTRPGGGGPGPGGGGAGKGR